MLLYCGIMFAAGAVLLVLAAKIAAGQVELIHDYHQKRVTDRAGYGKAFGKAMGLVALGPLLSGAAALVGADLSWGMGLLFGAMGAGIFAIVRVQKKYNGGLF